MKTKQNGFKIMWEQTPLWLKLGALTCIGWSLVYYVSAVLLVSGQAELSVAASGFEWYALMMKGLVGCQLLLVLSHWLTLLNQKTFKQSLVKQQLINIQKYLKRLHPLTGITTLFVVIAHSVWKLASFLPNYWVWNQQTISGVAALAIMLSLLFGGVNILLAPPKRKKKFILIHTIIAFIFLIPFFFHI